MKRIRRDQEGSALMLALVFLSLFGIAIAALLSLADTSFLATFAVRTQGKTVYAADGAIEGAINALRYGSQGAYGGQCDPFMVPVNGELVTVTCEPQVGSASPLGTNNSNNKPSKAILTLGTHASEGFDQASNSPLRVKGDVFSHSFIKNQAAKAVMEIEGDISAYGDCTGTITSTVPPLHCANTGGNQQTSNSTDPNYAHNGGALPFPAMPTCGSSWLIEFEPGRYTDAASLRHMFDVNDASHIAACSGKVFRFKPGNYYFDFEDADGNHEWFIQDANANIVGGTPKGWDPAAVTRPTIPFPGGCKTPGDPAPNDGIKFIFGNDSRIHIQAGTVELCAQPSTSAQQIAIYGVKTTTGSPPSPAPSPSASPSPSPSPLPSPTCPSPGSVITLEPTGISASQGTWTNIDQGKIIDGSTADSSLPAQTGGGSRSTVTLTGFNQATVPAGCDVTARLVLTHREGNTDMHSVTTVVTGVGASSTKSDSSWAQCSAATEICLQTSLAQNTVVLSELNQPSHFSNVSMTWEARASNNRASSEYLDGVRLELTLSEPPAPTPSPSPSPTGPPPGTSDYYRAQAGCILVEPYGVAGSCAVVQTDGAQTKMVLNGTVYAPFGAIDIHMTNVSSQVLGRGVVTRHLRMSVTPASSFTGPSIVVPDDSPGAAVDNRRVTLKAYIGGVLRLRAVVVFEDAGGSNPGQGVIVESWSVLR
jgi:hypothetical protein